MEIAILNGNSNTKFFPAMTSQTSAESKPFVLVSLQLLLFQEYEFCSSAVKVGPTIESDYCEHKKSPLK